MFILKVGVDGGEGRCSLWCGDEFQIKFYSFVCIGQNGKYWRIDGDNVSVDGDKPKDGFYLELREPTRITIR